MPQYQPNYIYSPRYGSRYLGQKPPAPSVGGVGQVDPVSLPEQQGGGGSGQSAVAAGGQAVAGGGGQPAVPMLGSMDAVGYAGTGRDQGAVAAHGDFGFRPLGQGGATGGYDGGLGPAPTFPSGAGPSAPTVDPMTGVPISSGGSGDGYTPQGGGSFNFASGSDPLGTGSSSGGYSHNLPGGQGMYGQWTEDLGFGLLDYPWWMPGGLIANTAGGIILDNRMDNIQASIDALDTPTAGPETQNNYFDEQLVSISDVNGNVRWVTQSQADALYDMGNYGDGSGGNTWQSDSFGTFDEAKAVSLYGLGSDEQFAEIDKQFDLLNQTAEGRLALEEAYKTAEDTKLMEEEMAAAELEAQILAEEQAAAEQAALDQRFTDLAAAIADQGDLTTEQISQMQSDFEASLAATNEQLNQQGLSYSEKLDTYQQTLQEQLANATTEQEAQLAQYQYDLSVWQAQADAERAQMEGMITQQGSDLLAAIDASEANYLDALTNSQNYTEQQISDLQSQWESDVAAQNDLLNQMGLDYSAKIDYAQRTLEEQLAAATTDLEKQMAQNQYDLTVWQATADAERAQMEGMITQQGSDLLAAIDASEAAYMDALANSDSYTEQQISELQSQWESDIANQNDLLNQMGLDYQDKLDYAQRTLEEQLATATTDLEKQIAQNQYDLTVWQAMTDAELAQMNTNLTGTLADYNQNLEALQQNVEQAKADYWSLIESGTATDAELNAALEQLQAEVSLLSASTTNPEGYYIDANGNIYNDTSFMDDVTVNPDGTVTENWLTTTGGVNYIDSTQDAFDPRLFTDDTAYIESYFEADAAPIRDTLSSIGMDDTQFTNAELADLSAEQVDAMVTEWNTAIDNATTELSAAGIDTTQYTDEQLATMSQTEIDQAISDKQAADYAATQTAYDTQYSGTVGDTSGGSSSDGLSYGSDTGSYSYGTDYSSTTGDSFDVSAFTSDTSVTDAYSSDSGSSSSGGK